ncbi:hypothetical protein B0H13DRAFT_1589846, partial [Mycena leptocephala]
PLIDSDRFAFALLGGHPNDPSWQKDVAEKAAELKSGAPPSTPASRQAPPRRGPFHAKTVGVSMGGGQKEPTGFFHSTLNTILIAQLLATEPFQRIAGFVNGMFRSYAPKLHEYYRSTMSLLYDWNEFLPRNFGEFTSVFAAATINFGPFTITLPHLDFANLAWGWCAVTALGNFDPNKGGHLILWDLRLVIRFPPSSTILLPSAIFRHSNVSIQQGERRFSFTQFTAAGVFRFVHNGFRTEKDINESRPSQAEKAKRATERANRWAEGMKMYKQWDLDFE